MNRKNLLIGLLSLSLIGTTVVGITACGAGKQQTETTEMERIYAQYVVYAQAEGQIPLSYDVWLSTVKGEKGEQGIQGEKRKICL